MSLLGNIVGGAIGFLVGGPVGAAAGAAIGGTKAAQDAADEAAKAAGFIVVEAGRVYMKYLEGVGKVYLSLGTFVFNALEDVGELFLNLPKGLLGMRPLRPSEKAIARQVFGNSIPLERIVISSLDGLSGRPFTVPGFMLQSMSWFIPGIGPLLAITSMVRGLTDKYILFLGNDGYNDAINYRLARNRDGTWAMGPGQNLVHELTHVWQGHNNGFAWGYVVNSLVRQAQNGTDAYKYSPGAQWNTYDAEPQAHIVEDWFNGTLNNAVRRPPTLAGFRASPWLLDPTLFLGAYIDCNIRPGLPNAPTVFPTARSNPTGTAITEVLKKTTLANKVTTKSAGSVAVRTLVPGATPIPTTYSDTMLVRTNPSLAALKLR